MFNHCFPPWRAFLLLLYWFTTFYLYAPLRKHSCHSKYNVYCPKVFIDWFMIMVSLILKLFVSSRPLKLEGVLCILCFALHEGQAENYLYVFLMIWTHVWLSFSWSFVCVLFNVYNMVAKFLLSWICPSCPCFKVLLIPAHNTYIYDQDCIGACHLKNYFFCYHLPTRGWAGVKLGDTDTSQMYL
jgi:hypothetical protein